ncbi:MAG: phage tail protein [Pseudomonadota bacterium]
MPEQSVPTPIEYRRRTRTYDAPRNNTSDVLNALALTAVPIGTILPTLASAAPSTGWLICNGQAISKTDFPTLYGILGGTYGETATTFNLPNMAGRLPAGAGGALALLGLAGAASISLSVAQLPAHTHGVTDPQHTHAFTGTPHGHSVTDPGHTHAVTDPGHAHTDDTNGTAVEVSAGTGSNIASHDAAGATSSETTGLSVDSATTGLTVQNTTAGGTNAAAPTGITVQSEGGGAAIDITPPVIGVNWIVRA